MGDTQTVSDPSDVESAITRQHKEYVTNSSIRESVIRRLVDGPAPVDEIAAKQSVSYGTTRKTGPSLGVSRTESAAEQLHDKGLVELFETDEIRAYGLTVSGEQVMFAIERDSEN